MAKFKVDDWVSIKGTSEAYAKAHILEVLTQKCEAGIVQNSYLCRVFVNTPNFSWEATTKTTQYREMELEERKIGEPGPK